MEGLIPLLLFGGLFFMMMRFGCGAHVVHGGHAKHDDHASHAPSHTDPVCGMKVTPEAGYGKMHEGKLVRFCSRDCLDKFEAEPERYTGKDKKEVAS